jgi:ribA/ribD-fused uncharacterized protein
VNIPEGVRGRIDNFRGVNRWLSNFWMEPFEYLTDIWPSSEHAYQAMKTQNMDERDEIRLAPTARAAKKLGMRVTLRPGWDDMRVDTMREILQAKFKSANLRMWLEMTGDAELIEGNTWGDKFWGQVDGVGENWLGRLLMELREELRREDG